MKFEIIFKNNTHISKLKHVLQNFLKSTVINNDKNKTSKPYFPVCDATLPLLLLSPLDFREFSFGCVIPDI
jgi:hypothetical protein